MQKLALTVPEFLRPLLAQPVAILGGGVSGVGACAVLANLGAESTIYDAKGIAFTAKLARSHRLVVFSPGFPPEHPWLMLARAAGCECRGELDFASLFWRGTVVAVTGTNGKTTLTEFLAHALRAVGRQAYATGNVGYSFSQLVADAKGGAPASIAVCEVSSFQAETMRAFNADATLWTNFAEDHLERHRTLESYYGAKWNLVTRTRDRGHERRRMGGRRPEGDQRSSGMDQRSSPTSIEPARKSVLFLGSSVQRYAAKFDRPVPIGAGVDTEDQPADERLTDSVFAEYPQRENFLLASAWWRASGLPATGLFEAARSFTVGPHRLARVVEHEGVVYWNDSKATNFHAVEAALARFSGPVVLIAGGKAKGGDVAGFIHRIAPRVKHAVLMGETSAELAFQYSAFRVGHTNCSTLAEAVRRAAEIAQPGDNVLLSPGFASFDMFRGYADRGEQFEKLVRELGTAASFR
jgi:UDP-N-acetylmuramoylalanine--D-glutamate ligase